MSNTIQLHTAIAALKPSATLLINERSKALLAEGKTVYRLGFGQSPFPVPSEVVASLQQYAAEKDYLPVKGLPALRTAVVHYNEKHLGIQYSAEDVLIGPGSKELILSLQMACDADLLLPAPSWVSYEPQAHLVGKKVVWIETQEKNRWLLSAQELDTACLAEPNRPKILILNFPSNPVGSTYQAEELKTLAEVAKKHKILVLSDEIYGALDFENAHESFANYYPEGTIISGGLSKWCGAGGWRLGTFTFPPAYRFVLDAMATIASESFSAVSAPIQYAAIRAFDGSPEIDLYLEKVRQILKETGSYVHRSLVKVGVTMPEPEGGFYLFPNFEHFRQPLAQKGVFTSEEFCAYLLDQTGVALLPGLSFGRPSTELTCRLSFVDFDGKAALEASKNEEVDEQFVQNHCPQVFKATKVMMEWLENLL